MTNANLIILTLLIASIPFFSNGQTKWITDNEMQFKIEVPTNYKQNQFVEGTDKILALVSPDENVAVRVRAMKATGQVTCDVVQQVFEQNIITGANRIMNESGDLHGIPATASAYTWNYNNIATVIGAYYIIQNGFAYIVWTIVPQNMLTQRSAEADKIIDSFSLLQSANLFAGAQNQQTSDSQVTLLNANLGATVDGDYRVWNSETSFNSNTLQINLSFSYSGTTFGTPFILKWYSRAQNNAINEYALNTPNENSGHGYGFISNQGNNWPQGNYYVEIWHDGKMLGTRDFQIQ